MKLSENINFVCKLGILPANALLRDWQEMAKQLEGRTICAEGQNKNLEDQVMTRDSQISCLKATLGRRDETIDRLKRITVEDANTAALNKHIANLTSENQRQKNTIRQLEDQNKNLEAALVKAETDVKERDEQIDRLKRMYDTDITARNADVRWLSKEREELKEQLDKQAKVLLLRCDGLVDLTNKMERQIHDLIQQRSFLQRKLEQMAQRNDNQSGSIRDYQEVRKLREQLEAEKAKPPRTVHYVEDPFKDAILDVVVSANGATADVLESSRVGVNFRQRRAERVIHVGSAG